MADNILDEKERIKMVYATRGIAGKDELYSFFSPARLFFVQQRERMLLELLHRYDISYLNNKLILDFGCGRGQVLWDFIKYGARPENIYGIDLLPDRIEEAKKLSPNINFRCTNAEELPHEPKTFDIVTQFTLFTSILDKKMKRNIAQEMLRVLKPAGMIIWYDFYMNNPRNPDVRGIKKREIKELFPNCRFDFKRLTLAPSITRAIAPYSWLLCYLLEKIPLLCTHYLVAIRKT